MIVDQCGEGRKQKLGKRKKAESRKQKAEIGEA
jgi:hypothetical protein